MTKEATQIVMQCVANPELFNEVLGALLYSEVDGDNIETVITKYQQFEEAVQQSEHNYNRVKKFLATVDEAMLYLLKNTTTSQVELDLIREEIGRRFYQVQ